MILHRLKSIENIRILSVHVSFRATFLENYSLDAVIRTAIKSAKKFTYKQFLMLK